ncbi:MAG: SDR family oxidoreductase, partial [Chloroflexota bacterium]|nr:SDR family oxidoreductase [Chloroflexota bacterium]
LVTGASGGIGRELAALLARDGHPLVLVARDRVALDRAAEEFRTRHGVEVTAFAFDLARPEAVTELVAELGRRGVAVEILVNNAGFGGAGPFAESDVERDLAMLRVNVLALTELTGRLLPAMVARKRGRILNLASTAAFQPGPFMAVYYASKAYVLSFSEAIAEELAGTGVTVTALCPGPTDTSFQHRAGTADTPLFQRGNVLDAGRVAAAGHAGMLAGKRVVVPGGLNWLGAQAVRFAPRRAVTALVRRMQEPVGG